MSDYRIPPENPSFGEYELAGVQLIRDAIAWQRQFGDEESHDAEGVYRALARAAGITAEEIGGPERVRHPAAASSVTPEAGPETGRHALVSDLAHGTKWAIVIVIGLVVLAVAGIWLYHAWWDATHCTTVLGTRVCQ